MGHFPNKRPPFGLISHKMGEMGFLKASGVLATIERSLLLRGHFPPKPFLSLLLAWGRARRRLRSDETPAAAAALFSGGGERGQKAGPLALAARGSAGAA